ncbi:MAG: sigma-70 family RNA polymerase sigma factor [Hyphomonadaceae bacterium]|nr:sigma-70 family RNA polymerase sigma factor [Hyphomonadaceae bacterium]
MTSSLRANTEHLKKVLMRRGLAEFEAEDIIQDALVRLEKYQKKQTVENESAFLVRVALNLMIDHHRKRAKVEFAPDPVEDYAIADDSPQPDEVFATKQRLYILNEGFKQLDPLTAEIIKARRLEGLKMKAIAERLGLSVSAVEKRMAKGLAFLIEWMEGS